MTNVEDKLKTILEKYQPLLTTSGIAPENADFCLAGVLELVREMERKLDDLASDIYVSDCDDLACNELAKSNHIDFDSGVQCY